MNEGIGKVLRFGAYSEEVIDRLRWMRDVLGPTLGKALRSMENGLAVNPLIAKAVAMVMNSIREISRHLLHS